jgi:hypothetical protein
MRCEKKVMMIEIYLPMQNRVLLSSKHAGLFFLRTRRPPVICTISRSGYAIVRLKTPAMAGNLPLHLILDAQTLLLKRFTVLHDRNLNLPQLLPADQEALQLEWKKNVLDSYTYINPDNETLRRLNNTEIYLSFSSTIISGRCA